MEKKSKKVVWLICKYASPKKYFFGTRHFSFGKEWIRSGHNVTIFTSNSSHLSDSLPTFKGLFFREFIDGIETFWINVFSPNNSGGFSRILSWIMFEFKLFLIPKKSLNKPDVIIVSSLSIFSIISGWYYSKRYKTKLILEIRDIWPLSAMELGGYSKWHPLMLFMSRLEKLGYNSSSQIVGTMPNLVAHVENVAPKNSDKVVCIPQCYDEEFYSEEQEKLSKDYCETHFSSEKFKIFYSGTINLNNPLDYIIQAVSDLDVELFIVGNGNRRFYYEESYKNQKNVKFLDPIPKSKVQDLLSHADICFDSIANSIGRFGLSRNKWIDYMMSKKPILCAFDGFQSMINEAGSGKYVPFDDSNKIQEAIIYFQQNPDVRQSMGKKGYQWLMENRSSKTLASQYEHIF